MKSAKTYSVMSGRAGELAFEAAPADDNPCAQGLKLAVFHLRSAAAELRKVAEYAAKQEKAES